MTWKAEGWDELMEALAEADCLLADGFDEALIGITVSINPVAAYSKDRMLEVLMQRDGMTYEDAIEYLEFNVFGAYVGLKTPVYIDNALL